MSNTDPSGDVLQRLEEAEKLKMEGQHEAAIEILEQLVLEDPSLVSALEEIADNELSLERYDRSQRAAERALDLDPESYTAEYILGFLSSQEEDWPSAVRHLQHANYLKANNSEIIRCLGWALFNGNHRTQGIVTLERALNLDRNNPLTLCDLGVAYLQARNFPKAKTLLSRTLDLDPNNTRARECVAAVERLERSTK
jgi:tetratricopeptide (TPR) repeat protein